MTTFFLILSAVLTIVSALPYIFDVIKGRTKPRIVTWFNWSLLTGIATVAAFEDGQIPSAVLTLAATIETFTVVLLGIRYGERKFDRFDVFCQIGAIVGIALWIIFNSPLVAVVATVTIDFLAFLTTARHSWKKPSEETMSTFALSGFGAVAALLAIKEATIVGLVFPVYLVAANFAIVAIMLIRKGRSARS